MMADTLVYGQAIYKPSLVIDVATFTRMWTALFQYKLIMLWFLSPYLFI